MTLIQPHSGSLVQLRLARNLTRSLKRGHPWVFADALRERPPAPPGTPAVLLDNKRGRAVAWGFYDARSPLAFRVCTVEPGQALDDEWADQQLSRAVALRQAFFADSLTTGFRLFNGEGDGLPGLIADLYGDTVVIQLDGPAPAGFWQIEGIAGWLTRTLAVSAVYERYQSRRGGEGRAVFGQPSSAPQPFMENGVQFTVDIRRGQKTGFFLDQRDNRQRIRTVAAGRRTLNLFGYTGGFSVYAGLGGASHVTTVDLAGPALAAAVEHWQINELPATGHITVQADAFKFLTEAAQAKRFWDLVIVDPPSFASSQGALPQALQAYRKLVAASAAVTEPEGILAVASCSSHVSLEMFLNACEEGISQAARRATVLGIYGQPPDHPFPLAFPEFRYLKFVLLRIE